MLSLLDDISPLPSSGNTTERVDSGQRLGVQDKDAQSLRASLSGSSRLSQCL